MNIPLPEWHLVCYLDMPNMAKQGILNCCSCFSYSFEYTDGESSPGLLLNLNVRENCLYAGRLLSQVFSLISDLDLSLLSVELEARRECLSVSPEKGISGGREKECRKVNPVVDLTLPRSVDLSIDRVI